MKGKSRSLEQSARESLRSAAIPLGIADHIAPRGASKVGLRHAVPCMWKARRAARCDLCMARAMQITGGWKATLRGVKRCAMHAPCWFCTARNAMHGTGTICMAQHGDVNGMCFPLRHAAPGDTDSHAHHIWGVGNVFEGLAWRREFCAMQCMAQWKAHAPSCAMHTYVCRAEHIVFRNAMHLRITQAYVWDIISVIMTNMLCELLRRLKSSNVNVHNTYEFSFTRHSFGSCAVLGQELSCGSSQCGSNTPATV